MASGGSGDMTIGVSTNMPSGGSREPKKYRMGAELEWDVYDDHTQKAWTGWKRVSQPWLAKIAMQYVGFPHFDQLWQTPCHEVYCRAIITNYKRVEDVKTK